MIADIWVVLEILGAFKARMMYHSYRFVGFDSLARLGHWMFGLGVQGISEGVKSFCEPCELACVVCNINHIESCMPVRNGKTVYA